MFKVLKNSETFTQKLKTVEKKLWNFEKRMIHSESFDRRATENLYEEE